LAKATGEAGRVYAVDVQPQMLELLAKRLKAEGIRNAELFPGTDRTANLPARQIDLALLVDVYHEFAFPYEMIQSICTALKPGGRLVLVEFRAEDPDVPIKEVHKMSKAQVRREMAVHPLEWAETVDTLPWQHVMVFRRTVSNSSASRGASSPSPSPAPAPEP
jgi:ubiquinone/menaquinone biosynthesis C-methylase UbiE